MKRRLMGAAAAIAVGCVVLTGCASSGGSASQSEGPVTGGDLTFVRVDEPETLFPAEITQNADIWTSQQIYDTLTRNKLDGSGVEPGLAESWKVSDDKLTWTFQLRQGVKFSDGSDLTAEDVVWSLDYNRTPSDAKAWTDLLSAITSVKADGDDTVVITVSKPWSPLPADLALFAAAIYPKDFGGKSEEQMRTDPIGSGPFKLDSWTKGQQLKLVRNDEYWGDHTSYLDSVTFKPVADDNTRMLQVQSGQADINEGLNPSMVDSVESSGTAELGKFKATVVNYLALNAGKAPFNDVHVRRALTLALDRAGIVDNVYYGVGTQATTFMSDGLWGHDSSIDALPYDVDEAKAEMAQSSTPDGFEATVYVQSGYSDRQQVAQIAQEAWKQIGVKLNIEVLDSTAVLEHRRAGDYDILTSYVTSDITDPDQMAGFLVETDNGINSGYSNPDIDELIDKARATDDQDERKSLYSQVQKLATEDAALIQNSYMPSLYSLSPKVHGFEVSTVGTYTLVDTWLEK